MYSYSFIKKIQISITLNLWNMVLKFCTSVITIFNIHKRFTHNVKVCSWVVSLTKFNRPYSNHLLVTAIKMKREPRIQMAVYCQLHPNVPKRKKWRSFNRLYIFQMCTITQSYQHITLYEYSATPTSEICMTVCW